MATLLARGQITIAAIKDGKDGAQGPQGPQGKPGADGKNYWQQDVWVDLSAATYDQNTWYTVVGEQLPQTGFAGIKVVVNLNSDTKPSWSTHSAGFSVDFHIDTQASGWGTTLAETIIYSDTFNFCSVSPVSYKQLGWGSRPILYLRGGGKYRVFSTYNAAWKIYKDGYTWQSGQYSQSAKPSSTRPTPEGHTLKGEKGEKGDQGAQGPQGKPGADGKNYWQQDVWVDLSAATYDQNTWYTVVGEQLPQTGFAGIKVVVNLNSDTKPSWSTHSAGFSVDFHIDTQASGWGTTLAETIIYSDTFNFCSVSPVSYKQLGWGSRPILYLRGGGKYRVFSTYNAAWKIYKDGYTWQSGQYSQSAKPSSTRPTPEGHTLKGDKGDKGDKGNKGDTGDRGPQGPTGAAGKDAVSASFSPAALTFSAKTDSNGNATANTTSGNTATITMLEGSSVVTGTYSITTMVGCEAVISGSTVTVKSVAHDTIDGRAISRTSASVTVKCVHNGKTCYVDLPISVSVSAVWGGLVTSQEKLESKYTEVSNKYNALPLKTPEALTQYTSTIKQSAREISLKVSQTAIGRKNLLVGSALRRQGEGVILRGGTSISVINQYNGVNSATCFGSSMPGLQWMYTRGIAHNIKVEKGKTYTISVMARATANSSIYIEGYYTIGMNTTDRPTGVGTGGSGALLNPAVGTQWQLYQRTFTVAADSPYEFLQIAIMAQPASDATVYLCQPMLVEGDEYVGWSLSEEDAEYIGGNLLDNTDTLMQGGNLVIASGNLYTDANSYKGFPTRRVNLLESTGAFLGILQWDLSNDGVLTVGQDYMFSFWAKGNIGGKFISYLYKDGNQVVYTEVLDRADGPNQHQAADGNAGVIFKEDYLWRQYWVHWRVVGSNLPKYVQIRCMKGCDLYISQPKLEYGATVTEYRATKTDFVEDKSVAGKLLDAGIDIDSKEITLTADKTKLRTQSGQEVAVFDKDGLNADLINAKHVWAKSENGKSTVGHFGNYEPDYCKVSDNVYAPLFMGSSTAANAPFYVTSTGAIKATAGYIGDFQIIEGKLVKEDSEGKRYMRLDNFNLSFEDTHDSIFRMTLGNFVSPSPGGTTYSGGFDLERLRNFSTSSTSSTSTQYNVGLTLSVSGTMNKDAREYQGNVISNIPNGNHALLISRGDIAGFRPMLTKATISRAISKMECVIVCTPPQNANIILTLPDDPEIGQYYKFIMRTGRYTGVSWGKVILRSNTSGKPITCYGVANSRECGLDWQFQVTELWFDGDYWVLQWHAQV